MQVFGTVGPSSSDGSPTTIYTLDSLPPVIYTAANNPGNPIYRQPFYTSPNISNGDHNLTITMGQGGTYWLDYLLYTQRDISDLPEKVLPPPADSPSTTSVSSSTATVGQATNVQVSSSSATFPATTQLPQGSSAPQANAASRRSSQSPGVIVVVTILFTVVVAAVVGGGWFLWRRRRRRQIDSFDLYQDRSSSGEQTHGSKGLSSPSLPAMSSYTDQALKKQIVAVARANNLLARWRSSPGWSRSTAWRRRTVRRRTASSCCLISLGRRRRAARSWQRSSARRSYARLHRATDRCTRPFAQNTPCCRDIRTAEYACKAVPCRCLWMLTLQIRKSCLPSTLGIGNFFSLPWGEDLRRSRDQNICTFYMTILSTFQS